MKNNASNFRPFEEKESNSVKRPFWEFAGQFDLSLQVFQSGFLYWQQLIKQNQEQKMVPYKPGLIQGYSRSKLLSLG